MALIDLIQQHLDDNTVSQLSQQLGADPATTREAVPAAITAILGGLSHNVQQPGGDQQLDSALAAHSGGILGGLGGLLGGSANSDGAGILGHIFGSHQPAVATQVGQRTGLDPSQAGRLLILLAPLVLGYLHHQRQQAQTGNPGNTSGDTSGFGSAGTSTGGVIGSISDILKGETTHIEQNHPQHGGILSSILSEVAGMAGGLLRGGQ